MSTNYNKFKNTQINDTNSLGYALSISGNLKMNNDNTSTIYSNKIYDYNNNYYLTSNNLFNAGTALEAAFNDVAVGGSLETGNILCSNDITSINIKSFNINVLNNLYINNVLYKNHQNIGFIYIGALNNISLPLANKSVLDTTTYYTNLNIQPYLINTYTNNSVLLQPFYSLSFYENDNILQVIDNTTGNNALYNTIQFNRSNTYCTKIIIQYKNKNI